MSTLLKVTQERQDDFLAALNDHCLESVSEEEKKVIIYLLADFFALVTSKSKTASESFLDQLSNSEAASKLAILASQGDMDDVDWHHLHHPGSVILPAVLAIGLSQKSTAEELMASIKIGYRSAAMFSSIMTPDIRKKWHSTSMAGAVGASHSIAFLLGLDSAGKYAALSLSCANLGGLSMAGLERNGAAQFNRAAATSLGVIAAQSAKMGVPFLPGAYSKLLEAWEFVPGVSSTSSRPDCPGMGLGTASLRLLPFSGYTQAAIHGCQRLLESSGNIARLNIAVAQSTYRLTVAAQTSANWVDQLWWDLPKSIEYLISGKYAFQRDRAPVTENSGIALTFEARDELPTQSAVIEVGDHAGHVVESEFQAPGSLPLNSQDRELWERKCTDWLRVSPDEAFEKAVAITSRGLASFNLRELLDG